MGQKPGKSKNKEKKNIKENKQKIEINNNINDIVIGIDFGSCGIAFAYGNLNNHGNREVINGRFEEQGKNDKVSNEIILDENLKEVLCFGNECNNFLNIIQEKKFHHFNHIKMNLYHKNYEIKATNSDKKVDIEYIITKILLEVKKRAIKQIELTKEKLNEKNFHWTITVPAIWDIKSKQIMINAAQNAGLIREDDDPSNFFTLEPEAASIYYHSSPHSFKDEHIDSGEPFILCDLGSGTADIVTQKKILENNEIKFEELYPPIGGDDGCNKINENFMNRVIKELFGEKCFNEVKEKICKNNYCNWVEFENKIEEFKKNYIKLEQLNQSFKIDCDIFDLGNDQNLEQLINNFNLNHPSWKLKIERSWKILFSFQIIHDLMLELINNIVEKYISKIIDSESFQDIKTLVFAGGASANPMLFNFIRNNEKLKSKIIYFLKSHNPEVAIAFGSVLYSYDHNKISPRKAKYTFGIKIGEIWNEKKHRNGGIKKLDKIDGKERCKNCFERFIKINEDLRPDDEKIKIFSMNMTKARIELFKTEREDVIFSDQKENGELIVFKFGEFIIDVGKDFDASNREIEVRMKMGGTFISASAMYIKTGKKVKITCLFE